jgi:hypothetical protein
VFEDFLEKLEFDKSDDEDKPDDESLSGSDKPKKK